MYGDYTIARDNDPSRARPNQYARERAQVWTNVAKLH
jgi:hypothetical protein